MTRRSLERTRRNVLRTTTALLAAAAGAGMSTAAESQPPAYDANTAYNGGDRVTFDGSIWEAEWWTKGTEPAESKSVWTKVGPVDGGSGGGDGGNNTGGDSGSKTDCSGVATYDPNATYSGGDRAVHGGALWEAKWWTSGTEPSASANPWKKVGSCNQGPTASITVTPSAPQPGDSVTFDASGSSDPDGSISAYEWTIDGSSASGETVTRTFQNERFVPVELTVTDGSGASATTSIQVAIGDPNRLPEATFAANQQFPQPGEAIQFDASGSSDPDGSIASYEWEFGDGSTGTGETVSYTYSSAGSYTVELTVTDGEGGTATASRSFEVSQSYTGEQRVVAYYRQWAQYGREYTPSDIPFDKVTHVQYAFARPEKDGSVNLVGGSYGQQAFWAQEDWQGVEGGTFAEMAKQHPDTNFVLSIGGWGDSEFFSDAALTEESRQKFAEDCVKWVKRGNLDGIDIDWEYPGGGGCTENSEGPACEGIGNNKRPGDQQRFTKLCRAVRDALDAHAKEVGRDEPYELTAAVSANPDVVEGQADGMKGLEHGKLADILDFVQVMTFDYRGIFSEYTGHHAPLKENPNDPFAESDVWNASYALDYWQNQGWEPEQLNMAVPFYGRSWDEVQKPDGKGNGRDDGLFQPYKGTGADASGDGSFPGPGNQGTSLAGVFEAFDLLGSGRGNSNTLDLDSSKWTTYFDETAVASYSFNDSSRLMISHPTEQSIRRKMEWLSSSPYGGTMLWAIGSDTKDHTLATTLWSTLNG